MEARRIAWTCAGAVIVTLLIVVWSGSLLLDLFGISLNSLRAAGGVIVPMIGLQMLWNKWGHNQSQSELEDCKPRASVGVVPLAIPVVAGPGTMAAVLVAAEQHPLVLSKVEVSVVVVVLSALVGLLFSFAEPMARRRGDSGMGVVTRVMGMVLAAIAVGMLAEGLKGMMPGLAGS